MRRSFTRNFRFLNSALNVEFIELLERERIQHRVDNNGVVYFDPEDEEEVEDVLAKVRDEQFPAWQIRSCPPEWVNKYRREMKRRRIQFVEELNDGKIEFLLSQRNNPHEWELA
jgi:hypothetical protein